MAELNFKRPTAQSSQSVNPTSAHLVDDEQFQRQLLAAPRPIEGRHSNIVNFYKNKSILITGASGFVGKVLIEKLLRTCPNLGRIFVVIRPKRNKQPEERLRELLEAPLFDGVRNSVGQLEKRVVVLEGDIMQQQFGLSENNLMRIINEVSVVFHSAATVKFDEPLKQSIAVNIAGTKNLIDLCRRMPKLAALVHVSTAYANCDRREVDEHIYPVDMEPEKLLQMADWLDQDTLQELKRRLLGARPNTYTYTKAVAEWLVARSARDLPLVICRPSIVVASRLEPFAGWIDNVNGPTGIILGTGKGLIRSMYCEPKYVADMIPVDTVINLMVALGWFAHLHHGFQARNQAQCVSDVASELDESLNGDCSASNSSFDLNIERQPSLLYETELLDDRHNLSEEDEEQAVRTNKTSRRDREHHHHHHHINTTTNTTTTDSHRLQVSMSQSSDDGYGSRSSSNYANSIASSTSSTLQRTEKQRHHLGLDLSMVKMATSIERTTAAVCPESALNIDEEEELRNQETFDNKLKQFQQNVRNKLIAKDLPEHLADIPVFHCTSGAENPITWARTQILVMSFLTLFPSITTYRYPVGSFTNNRRLNNFYRVVCHYIPAYIADFVAKLFGGKPTIVRIFNKFDQAAGVLEAFTTNEWTFSPDNRLFFINNFMNDEDKRLFDCDIKSLDWTEIFRDYCLGVKRFLLKEPISNLDQARKNLTIVYYRNLILQVLMVTVFAYNLKQISWFLPTNLVSGLFAT